MHPRRHGNADDAQPTGDRVGQPGHNRTPALRCRGMPTQAQRGRSVRDRGMDDRSAPRNGRRSTTSAARQPSHVRTNGDTIDGHLDADPREGVVTSHRWSVDDGPKRAEDCLVSRVGDDFTVVG